MKVVLALFIVVTLLHLESAEAQRGFFRRGYNYARNFGRGSRAMWNAYRDMRRANTIGADKYFHARGNYDASRFGTGGRHAARLISNAREMYQGALSGRGASDSAADQRANRWGRNGGDPNRFRPRGLNPKY